MSRISVGGCFHSGGIWWVVDGERVMNLNLQELDQNNDRFLPRFNSYLDGEVKKIYKLGFDAAMNKVREKIDIIEELEGE